MHLRRCVGPKVPTVDGHRQRRAVPLRRRVVQTVRPKPIIRTLIHVIRALISVLRALVTVVRSFIAVIRAPFTVIRALIAVIRTRTEAGGVIRVVRRSLCQTERRVGYRAVWDTTQAQVQVLE